MSIDLTKNTIKTELIPLINRLGTTIKTTENQLEWHQSLALQVQECEMVLTPSKTTREF